VHDKPLGALLSDLFACSEKPPYWHDRKLDDVLIKKYGLGPNASIEDFLAFAKGGKPTLHVLQTVLRREAFGIAQGLVAGSLVLPSRDQIFGPGFDLSGLNTDTLAEFLKPSQEEFPYMLDDEKLQEGKRQMKLAGFLACLARYLCAKHNMKVASPTALVAVTAMGILGLIFAVASASADQAQPQSADEMRRNVQLGKSTQKINPVVADLLNGEEFSFLTQFLSLEHESATLAVQDSAFNVSEEEEEANDNLALLNGILGRSLSKEGGSASGALAGRGRGMWTEARVIDAVQAVRGVRGFRAFFSRDFTSRIRFLV